MVVSSVILRNAGYGLVVAQSSGTVRNSASGRQQLVFRVRVCCGYGRRRVFGRQLGVARLVVVGGGTGWLPLVV